MECGNQFCRAIRTKNSLTFENWFRKKRLKQLYKIIRWFDKFHLNVVKIANRTANKIISQSKWFLSQKIGIKIVNFDPSILIIKSKSFKSKNFKSLYRFKKKWPLRKSLKLDLSLWTWTIYHFWQFRRNFPDDQT